jgi:hypothetical protein
MTFQEIYGMSPLSLLGLAGFVIGVIVLAIAVFVMPYRGDPHDQIKVGHGEHKIFKGVGGIIKANALANDRVRGGYHYDHKPLVTVVITNFDLEEVERRGLGLSLIRGVLLDGSSAPGIQVVNKMSEENTEKVLESGGTVDEDGNLWYQELSNKKRG